MINRKRGTFAVILSLFVIFSTAAYSQKLQNDGIIEELKSKGYSQKYDTTNVSSVEELHNWFTRKHIEIERKNFYSKYRLIPSGIYRIPSSKNGNPWKWSLGLAYHHPLRTSNVRIGVSRSITNRSNISLIGFFGAGQSDVKELDSKIEMNFGAGLEYSHMITKYINPLVGFQWYIGAEPKIGNIGDGFILYGGDRIYFTKEKQFSLDLKVGKAFWSGFNEMLPGLYLNGGLTMHRTADMTRISPSQWGPLEAGLHITPSLSTGNLKVMIPWTFCRELSVAPFGFYGRDIGKMKDLKDEVAMQYGAGLEMRLFSNYIQSNTINPYLGVRHHWISYEETNGTSNGSVTGTGFSFYAGARVRLFKNVSLDVNLGPVFWEDDYPKEKPDNWIANVGLTAALGKKKVKPICLEGSLYTKINPPGEYTFDSMSLLKSDSLMKYNCEVRTYDYVKLPEPPKPLKLKYFGDISDIKFYYFNFDLGMFLENIHNYFIDQENINPMSYKQDIMNRDEEEKVYIIALFNNNSVNSNSLNANNMLFHFIDFDNDQYFGYLRDGNKIRRPEYRHGHLLGDTVQNTVYMGHYSEFIRPMKWLKDGEIKGVPGKYIDKMIFRTFKKQQENDSTNHVIPSPDRQQLFPDDYKIAYVEYPLKTIKRINSFKRNRNYGASLMIVRDVKYPGCHVIKDSVKTWYKKNNIYDIIASTDIVRYDSADDFVFTNHVEISDLYKLNPDVVIRNFELGELKLLDSHIDTLRTVVIPYLKANEDMKIEICGFSDGTPLTEKGEKLYKTLDNFGLARATSVIKYLTDNGISENRIIKKEGKVKNIYKQYFPPDRCVAIYFVRY